ncbi:hypothetical protein D3Z60_26160 [Lachnospiraceae bacterium]|nr:hypothetical protein [Lachnospiraceae bacterium]
MLPKVFDVETDYPVVQLHIRLVVEHLQGTIHIDFQRSGDPLCLYFLLLPQALV